MRFAFLPWVILFLPLLATGAMVLGARRSARVCAQLSVGAIGLGFLATVIFVLANGWSPTGGEIAITWFAVGPLQVEFGLRLDALSLMMLLVVTGVGGLIHVYSLGYMKEDPGYRRYFAYLSLFTFSMLGIVLANNFLMMFVFWELVGVSSYLLIGFWYGRPAAADAAKKAFLTNRIGDFGFLLGILSVWALLGTLNFSVLERVLTANPTALGGLATLVGLLIFCGAVGKSAQFPLHVWLPDAMEGPTPVSALIHAATMVAAGVYLLCRVFFILDLPDSGALTVVAWVGGITALLAAVIALQQDDIKRILAYSTLSQLGYMVMAVGVSGAVASMYHLTTHAFFKALLFLGAGSVIQSLHHEQNIWKMGGLAWRMPVTFGSFLVATLALCGVPPFSGFFSKDGILAATLSGTHGSVWLFLLGGGVAALTTLYMFRLVFVVFMGTGRTKVADQSHESGAVMTTPMVILAVPSLLAGFWGIPAIYGRVLPMEAEGHAGWAVVVSLLAVMVGFVLAFWFYRDQSEDPLAKRWAVLTAVARDRFYFDELYRATVIRFQDGLGIISEWVDRWLIGGLLVRGLAGFTDLLGRVLRLIQTGNLQTYAILFVLGVALVILFAMCRF